MIQSVTRPSWGLFAELGFCFIRRTPICENTVVTLPVTLCENREKYRLLLATREALFLVLGINRGFIVSSRIQKFT